MFAVLWRHGSPAASFGLLRWHPAEYCAPGVDYEDCPDFFQRLTWSGAENGD